MSETESNSFVVDRSKWRFGGRQHDDYLGETLLLNSNGFMCCLGFASKACGLQDNDILLIPSPDQLGTSCHFNTMYKKLLNMKYFPPRLSTLAEYAIYINDLNNINNKMREQRLIELFAEEGITLSFTGEYPSNVSKDN